MAIIIPEKMYVGFQARSETQDDWKVPYNEREYKEVRLGFATYYEENAAFEKRKATIDNWSQPYYRNTPKEIIPAEIIDNQLLDGFKMAREVRRHGWGSGNVLWRIEDPRGFELEISSANMASIMACTTIINGEIQGKCKWGWNTVGGSRVVLLPEGSEPYQDAIRDTKRRNAATIPMKDVSPGMRVELKNEFVGVYCGPMHYLYRQYGHSYNYGSDDNPNEFDQGWISSNRKIHFFLQDDGVVYMMSSPKVANILDDSTTFSVEDGVDLINTQLRIEAEVAAAGTTLNVVFVSSVPIKESDYASKLVPIEYQDFKTICGEADRYQHHLCGQRLPIVTLNDNLHDILMLHQSNLRNEKEIESSVVDGERLRQTCTIKYRREPVTKTYMWMGPRRTQQAKRILNKDTLECLPLFIFMIEHKGQLYSPRIY